MLNQPGLKTKMLMDREKMKLVKSDADQFGWEVEVSVTKTEIFARGYAVNSTPKTLSLVLDGFGLGVQFEPDLLYRGPPHPPAPPIPFSVEIPTMCQLALEKKFLLKNYEYQSGQKIQVEIFLSDAFGKTVGFKSKEVSLP